MSSLRSFWEMASSTTWESCRMPDVISSTGSLIGSPSDTRADWLSVTILLKLSLPGFIGESFGDLIGDFMGNFIGDFMGEFMGDFDGDVFGDLPLDEIRLGDPGGISSTSVCCISTSMGMDTSSSDIMSAHQI